MYLIKLQMRHGAYKQHMTIIHSARGLQRKRKREAEREREREKERENDRDSFVEHSNINKIYCNDLTCYFEN